MKFKRGIDPKESMDIGLHKRNKCLPDLLKLFPKLSSAEIDNIIKLFELSEEDWDINRKRFNPYSINNEGKTAIKYLLICEAPPSSGNYFYKSPTGYLFKQVWKSFFGNQPICTNPNSAYQCLANQGFLLIDSLPFPIKYSSQDRRKPAYQQIIKCYLLAWLHKLDSNFIFSPDLKIAFGFKLNALAIINANPKGINLSGIQRPINPKMIAAGGAGQPTSALLAKAFKIKGNFNC